MPSNDEVVITVTEAPPGTFQIELDNEPFNLAGLGTPRPIRWRIDDNLGSTWYFSSTGIGITRPPSSGVFDPPANGPGPRPRVVTSNRRVADNNFYKYSISVTNGNTTLVVDPSIINYP